MQRILRKNKKFFEQPLLTKWIAFKKTSMLIDYYLFTDNAILEYLEVFRGVRIGSGHCNVTATLTSWASRNFLNQSFNIFILTYLPALFIPFCIHPISFSIYNNLYLFPQLIHSHSSSWPNGKKTRPDWCNDRH